MYDIGLDRPNVRCYSLYSHHICYVLRPEIVVCIRDVKRPT
jgi:hypothetical protein